MDDGAAGPYRGTAIAARQTAPPARLVRPMAPRVLTGCVGAAGVVACVLGAPIALVTMSVIIAAVSIGERHRARALARLAALPFPVEHSHHSAVAATSLSRRAIRSATVHLVSALDDDAAERFARDAAARAPELTLLVDGAAIEITGWRWRADDALLLAGLLTSWGRALHVEHPIASVRVTWVPGGPPPTL